MHARFTDRLLLTSTTIVLVVAFLCGGVNIVQAAADALVITPPAGSTVIPVGDWTMQALAWFRDVVISALATFVVVVGRKLPVQLGNMIRQVLTDNLIAKAVDYAIGAVDGAVRGKEINISTANQLVAVAEQAAIQFGPHLATMAGNMLKPMIVARLSQLNVLPVEAHGDALNAPLPTPSNAAMAASVATSPDVPSPVK